MTPALPERPEKPSGALPAHGMSIRYKILLSALLSILAVVAATTWLSVRYEAGSIRRSEHNSLLRDFHTYRHQVEILKDSSAGLASSMSDRPEVVHALHRRDRSRMLSVLGPIFDRLKEQFRVSHLYVHEPNGYVFLRVHQPGQYGDAFISYRQTIVEALASGRTVSGVEIDTNRIGVRGVSPVLDRGELLGLIEVALDHDQPFLNDLKRRTGADFTLWISREAAAPTGLWPKGDEPAAPVPQLFYFAGTTTPTPGLPAQGFQGAIEGGEPEVFFVAADGRERAVLLAPLVGFQDRVIGVMEIVRSRQAALAELRQMRWSILGVAGIVACLSLAMIWIGLRQLVLRPLEALAEAARRQLEGDLQARVGLLPPDEYGHVGATFNLLSDQLAQALESQNRTIADLRRAREELEKSENRLSITLNSIGDGVIAADAAGRITRMNPVAEQMTGWAAGEALGHHLDEVFRVFELDSGRPVVSPLTRALEEERVVKLGGRSFLLSRQGARRQIADSGAPIRDNEDRLVGAVIVFRDVTEEQELQDRLRQSQKMEAVGQLAGGVAHDFNNLLTAIMGNAQLVLGGVSKDSQVARFAADIDRAAARAADLTRQLLAFSRKAALQNVQVNVHEVIQAVIGLLRHSIDKRVEIVAELEAEVPTVKGDPSQIQSAILNLALNARDAMPEGGRLTFGTRVVAAGNEFASDELEELAPGSYIEISVADTGVGMDSVTQARIFEPFFTTKGPGEGTGLGLAAVYGCVHSHGGRIRVYSEVGQGSEFKVLLPQSTEGIPLAGGAAEDSLVKGEGRVLVVDDEDMVRFFTQRALKSLGYEVVLAANGREAVELFEGQHETLDLVLLDLIMPEMSGEDAFQRMRTIDPQVPVVIASGFSHSRTVERLLRGGASGFLNKPYRIQNLSRALARALKRP